MKNGFFGKTDALNWNEIRFLQRKNGIGSRHFWNPTLRFLGKNETDLEKRAEKMKNAADYVVSLYHDVIVKPKASTIIKINDDNTFEIVRS